MEASLAAQACGPALARLVARISGTDAPSPTQPLPARLGQWIDWRQAVVLSGALEAVAAPPAGATPAPEAEDADCARVRAAVLAAIEGDRAFGDALPPSVEPAFFRQRYLLLQQVMGADIALLRKRLRERLARRGGAAARLAALDAAMEQSVGARERALLGTLPDLLARHGERLRASLPEPDAAPGGTPPWLTPLRRDMRLLLVAELDLRMQPVQGLIAALRTPVPVPHDP